MSLPNRKSFLLGKDHVHQSGRPETLGIQQVTSRALRDQTAQGHSGSWAELSPHEAQGHQVAFLEPRNPRSSLVG